jgi:hypothetical protein
MISAVKPEARHGLPGNGAGALFCARECAACRVNQPAFFMPLDERSTAGLRDQDVAEGAEVQQIEVAGDDEEGLRGERGGEHEVIVRIAADGCGKVAGSTITRTIASDGYAVSLPWVVRSKKAREQSKRTERDEDRKLSTETRVQEATSDD